VVVHGYVRGGDRWALGAWLFGAAGRIFVRAKGALGAWFAARFARREEVIESLAGDPMALTLAYLRSITRFLIMVVGAVAISMAPSGLILSRMGRAGPPETNVAVDLGILLFAMGFFAVLWPILAFLSYNEITIVWAAHRRYQPNGVNAE